MHIYFSRLQTEKGPSLISIVDYGCGNVGSLHNMFTSLGVTSQIIYKPQQVVGLQNLLIPGVGAFDNAMMKLNADGWVNVLNHHAITEKRPTMGICLGMQLFGSGSEEGSLDGLNFIKAKAVKFDPGRLPENHKIPHIRWNQISQKKDPYLFKTDPQHTRFYFVHSYHLVCKNQSDVLTTTKYGYEFVSAVKHKNILGVQFHPEKSHRYGRVFFEHILESFLL